MREILFRGKTLYEGEWITGYLSKEPADSNYYIQPVGKNICDVVNPETVGQYTGVDDCTGRKIFEGDLVKGFDNYTGEIYQDVTGLVKFYKGSFGAEWSGCFEPFSITDDEIIVIGNIHDNPELTKGE